MLKIEHLTKVYENGTVALRDISFEVPDGQFVVIIGLSGSGKSTLLRCINRLIDPTEGRITWNGIDITAANDEELRRSAADRDDLPAVQPVKRSKVITNVRPALGYTNPMWSLVNRFRRTTADALPSSSASHPRKSVNRADELSGGQQQRVASPAP